MKMVNTRISMIRRELNVIKVHYRRKYVICNKKMYVNLNSICHTREHYALQYNGQVAEPQIAEFIFCILSNNMCLLPNLKSYVHQMAGKERRIKAFLIWPCVKLYTNRFTVLLTIT